MNKLAATRPDWQTIVAAASLVGLVFFVGRAFLTKNDQPATSQQSRVVRPITQTGAKPLVLHLSSTPIDGAPDIYRNGREQISAAKLSLEQQASHMASLGVQQLDYETSRRIQTQVIDRLRHQIREHGVGSDGVTEADLDNMLKNGQIPQ